MLDMKKILFTLFSIILFVQGANAMDSAMFNKAIHNSGIHKGAVSVSVKDLSTGKTVAELNSEIPTSPASTQKLLTYLPALTVLGENYNFSTSIYKTKTGDYYLVLGADPYLTTADLYKLISQLKLPQKSEVKNLYIDDTVLDNQNWGEGWQWDDDLNILMPKFGSYNLDKNLYTIVVSPTKVGSPADIFANVFYPTTFINQTKTTLNLTKVDFSRENYISPDSLTVSGPVAKTVKVQIPVNYLRRYFLLRMDDSFAKAKLSYYGKYQRAKLPKGAVKVAEIKHPISKATIDVLKNSNNLVAETVFKLAGGKHVNGTGSTPSAIAMFNTYCSINKLDCSKIRLTDGSGVSKNNLVTADFMSDYIVKTTKIFGQEKLEAMLTQPKEGTLTNRFFNMQGRLWAKTGTLSNISGITGLMIAKSGKTYAFSIYINDGKSSESNKKMLEEFIVKAVYDKF